MENKIEMIGVDEIIPYVNNPKIHTEEQIKMIASSIKEFGFINPVVIDKDNVIIAGHGRYKASKLLGLGKIPCLRAEHLTGAQIRAYRIADNRLAELSEWDEELLTIELEEIKEKGIDIDTTGFSIDDIEQEIKPENEEEDTIYTKKIEAPIYEPKGEKPNIGELVNLEKTKELIREIDESDIAEKEKEFLKIAAYRHAVFDYGKIAEYYAHSDKKTQELMEKSALVIIDFDKAIENGFVKMTKLMLGLLENEE